MDLSGLHFAWVNMSPLSTHPNARRVTGREGESRCNNSLHRTTVREGNSHVWSTWCVRWPMLRCGCSFKASCREWTAHRGCWIPSILKTSRLPCKDQYKDQYRCQLHSGAVSMRRLSWILSVQRCETGSLWSPDDVICWANTWRNQLISTERGVQGHKPAEALGPEVTVERWNPPSSVGLVYSSLTCTWAWQAPRDKLI